MSFAVLPPEINSLRIFAGAGSAPMLEAAVAWDGLSAELGTAAESFASVTSGLTGQAWQGAAAKAMAAVAAPYSSWLSAAAARAAGAAGQAKMVASAFEAARSAMVHPLAVAANRNVFVQLVTSNLFGQNAPAIAATEGTYEEMWAADVAAMVGYHGGASAAASGLPSWQQALSALPGIGQAAAAPAAALFNLPTVNTGLGNSGQWNLGGGNNGSFNLGSGNFGNLNLGGGNIGNLNLGGGNFGFVNLGNGNIGNTNFGSGNIGNLNFGGGNLGNGNFGLGNFGSGNFGNANGMDPVSFSTGNNIGDANLGCLQPRQRQHRFVQHRVGEYRK